MGLFGKKMKLEERTEYYEAKARIAERKYEHKARIAKAKSVINRERDMKRELGREKLKSVFASAKNAVKRANLSAKSNASKPLMQHNNRLGFDSAKLDRATFGEQKVTEKKQRPITIKIQ